MWREPGRFDCANCHADPGLLAYLGNCGGVPETGRLNVIVGEPVDACPTALGLSDPDVLRIASLVPGPAGDGDLDGVPPSALPPRYRDAVLMARVWLDVSRRKGGGGDG